MMEFLMKWLGLTNASGPQYLFWSGFFGDVTIIAGAIGLYFHHNCHARGCPRWGRHKFEGTPYCALHHPNLNSQI